MGLDPLRNKSFEKKNLLLLRRVLKLLATLNMIIGEINIITTTKHNHINIHLIHYPCIFPTFVALSAFFFLFPLSALQFHPLNKIQRWKSSFFSWGLIV